MRSLDGYVHAKHIMNLYHIKETSDGKGEDNILNNLSYQQLRIEID
jgi:hypothetical protein